MSAEHERKIDKPDLVRFSRQSPDPSERVTIYYDLGKKAFAKVLPNVPLSPEAISFLIDFTAKEFDVIEKIARIQGSLSTSSNRGDNDARELLTKHSVPNGGQLEDRSSSFGKFGDTAEYIRTLLERPSLTATTSQTLLAFQDSLQPFLPPPPEETNP